MATLRQLGSEAKIERSSSLEGKAEEDGEEEEAVAAADLYVCHF